jgi:hypothetical protein
VSARFPTPARESTLDVRVNFEDKQEMILMLVPLVVAMWGARSRRPGGHVKSASKAPG